MNDSALGRALSYRRFQGPPHLLVMDGGYYVFPDVIEGARELGYEVSTVAPCSAQEQGSRDFIKRLLSTLCTRRPDFLFTINHMGFDAEGRLTDLLAQCQVPVASWFVDSPLPILGRCSHNAQPNTQIFCIERTALSWLRDLGFRDPVHLPTAAARPCDPARIDQALAAQLGAPLSFVGDSWWRRGWGVPPAWAAGVAARLGQHLGGLTKGRFRELTPAQLEAGLVHAGLRSAAPAGQDDGYEILGTALGQAASAERVALARALLPLGLRVYGDSHWAELVPGLDLRAAVDLRSQTPAVFAGSAISLNCTGVHLPTANNQRVWDVPAAGGFLLTDAQEDTHSAFEEGREVVTYRTPEEAAERARYYLTHPVEREAISQAARSRVERQHRYTHRVQQLVNIMRARFA